MRCGCALVGKKKNFGKHEVRCLNLLKLQSFASLANNVRLSHMENRSNARDAGSYSQTDCKAMPLSRSHPDFSKLCSKELNNLLCLLLLIINCEK